MMQHNFTGLYRHIKGVWELSMKGCIVIICTDYVTSSENYIAKIKYFMLTWLDTILFLALSVLLHVLLRFCSFLIHSYWGLEQAKKKRKKKPRDTLLSLVSINKMPNSLCAAIYDVRLYCLSVNTIHAVTNICKDNNYLVVNKKCSRGICGVVIVCKLVSNFKLIGLLTACKLLLPKP